MASKYWEITNTEIYRQQVEIVKRYIGRQLVARHFPDYQQRVSDLTIHAESPAEAVFALWWEAVTQFLPEPTHLSIHPQATILLDQGNRRADFCVYCTDAGLLQAAASIGLSFNAIVVEIDGHAFHERTRDQATDRNQRDRDLQLDNFHVMHFSYAELVDDPSRCVAEVVSAGRDQCNALRIAVLEKAGGPPS